MASWVHNSLWICVDATTPSCGPQVIAGHRRINVVVAGKSRHEGMEGMGKPTFIAGKIVTQWGIFQFFQPRNGVPGGYCGLPWFFTPIFSDLDIQYLNPKDPNSFNHSASWVGLGDRIGRHRASAWLGGIELVEKCWKSRAFFRAYLFTAGLISSRMFKISWLIYTHMVWVQYLWDFPTLYFSSLSHLGPSWAILGHLGPSWAPLPSAEGGSHSMVTPRVDRDFTSKLVGIEGLGRCCGENPCLGCLRWSGISPDLYLSLLESGWIRFYMVLHGFTVLPVSVKPIKSKSNNYTNWVELREDPRETIVRRSFWKLSQLILRLVHILHVSCANIRTHMKRDWLKMTMICSQIESLTMNQWTIVDCRRHPIATGWTSSGLIEKQRSTCTYYHELFSGYPSSNVAGKSSLNIVKYH